MKSAYNFVPAIMGMLLMLICAMMTSISIVKEKEKGTMEVLLVSPVRPIVIILAKVVPYLIVAFGILAVILLMSKFVLGIPIQGALMWIILISVIYILLALSLGMLISNVAKTQFVALIMSVMMLLMPIVMLSGMLFPVEKHAEGAAVDFGCHSHQVLHRCHAETHDHGCGDRRSDEGNAHFGRYDRGTDSFVINEIQEQA